MKRTLLHLLYTLSPALLLPLAACSQGSAEATKPVEFLGLVSSLPASWVEEQPTSSMRLAQYRIPGSNADQQAQLVLFYFGQGQGGTVEANISRWQSQFSNPQGGSVKADISNIDANGVPATVVELRGDYARGTGMGPVGTASPDQILLASIVETTRGNVYIQLHGPAAVVSNHRDAYLKFIGDIRPGPGDASRSE